MVEFLRNKKSDRRFEKIVVPRKPFRKHFGSRLTQITPDTVLGDVEDVSLMISEIEADGKGIPVLIKQYLKLAGTFVSFNVDKKFSNVVDGLIVIDLMHTDPKLLRRFMGSEYADLFRSQHLDEPDGLKLIA